MKSYTHRWSHSEVAPADAWAEVKAAAFAVMLAAGSTSSPGTTPGES